MLGGTGLIGSHFVRCYHRDVAITVISRNSKRAQRMLPNAITYDWRKLDEKGFIDEFDAVINLAGAGIGDKRWSEKRKKILLASRLDTTKHIVDAILHSEKQPRLLNASAIGIYGYQQTVQEQILHTFDEENQLPPTHQSFSTDLVQHWEALLKPLEKESVPSVCMRFGVVLAPWGGALKKMLPAFKLGLGGKIGSGKQPFSWVSIYDVVRAIAFLLTKPDITGPVNIVAPDVVRQMKLAQLLGKALHRPAMLPMPSLAVKMLFGQMGEELLLNGQYVKSKRLREAGFEFRYDDLQSLLYKMLNQ